MRRQTNGGRVSVVADDDIIDALLSLLGCKHVEGALVWFRVAKRGGKSFDPDLQASSCGIQLGVCIFYVPCCRRPPM